MQFSTSFPLFVFSIYSTRDLQSKCCVVKSSNYSALYDYVINLIYRYLYLFELVFNFWRLIFLFDLILL